MVVSIRLVPVGKKVQRSYQIEVIDSRRSRDSGSYLEHLGYWNPEQNKLELNQKEYQEWLKKGAQPTDSLNLRYNKPALINDLENLPTGQIKISASSFSGEKAEEEKNNFSVKDLKKKLKERNFWLIKGALLDKWEKRLVEKIFKIEWRKQKGGKKKSEEKKKKGCRFWIGKIFAVAGKLGTVKALKEEDKVSPLSNFNFEFSITLPKENKPTAVYTTKNSPLSIINESPK